MQPASTSRRGILEPEAARRQFRLTRYEPAPGLAEWVERHWVVEWDLRGRPPFTQELVTHPCVNLVIERDRAAVHGVVSTRSAHDLEGAGKVVATKFRPGAFHAFLPVPAWTLTDRAVALNEAFGDAADELVAAVRVRREDRAQVALVEDFLRELRPARDPRIREIARISARILAEPEITRVEHLSVRTGMSARRLQRLFREYIGVTPKWVLQRCRVHEAAERMADGGGGDWAMLALDLGYFDQAHFIKDFKAVVGRSPADYAAACAAVAAAA